MTELEKIKRAKMYVDKLANGINPIDDTKIPDEDIINHVRLSRCLFFVSDVLRQVIENGGTKTTAVSKNPKKLPLEISLEQRNRFAYSEIPIAASEIAKRVNALVNEENRQKLTYDDILTWLIEIGMMEFASTPDGERTRQPTENGIKNGISVEERAGNNGIYYVVVYNIVAQHFVIDNLDAILAVKKERTEMQGAPWTKEQDERLIDLYEKSAPISEIAMVMKRSTSAVRGRLKRLGLIDSP
jgi:hypothetical protein